jgi:hypothetical protein
MAGRRLAPAGTALRVQTGTRRSPARGVRARRCFRCLRQPLLAVVRPSYDHGALGRQRRQQPLLAGRRWHAGTRPGRRHRRLSRRQPDAERQPLPAAVRGGGHAAAARTRRADHHRCALSGRCLDRGWRPADLRPLRRRTAAVSGLAGAAGRAGTGRAGRRRRRRAQRQPPAAQRTRSQATLPRRPPATVVYTRRHPAGRAAVVTSGSRGVATSRGQYVESSRRRALRPQPRAGAAG